MGDRCWVQLKFRKSDMPTVRHRIDGPGPYTRQGGVTYPLFDEVVHEGDGWIEGLIHEGNYGLFRELGELHEAEIPFVGSSGTGGEYGPAVFACDGNRYHHIEASHENVPILGIGKEGEFIPEDGMRRIQEYYLTLKDADKIIEGKEEE